AKRLQPRVDLVVATQDRHLAGRGRFASMHPGRKPADLAELAGLRQVLWPDHCVQGTPGAEFAPGGRICWLVWFRSVLNCGRANAFAEVGGPACVLISASGAALGEGRPCLFVLRNRSRWGSFVPQALRAAT